MRNTDMLASLIFFFMDLTFALALFVIAYTAFLTVTVSIFISALFHFWKAEKEESYDFNMEGRIWILNTITLLLGSHLQET